MKNAPIHQVTHFLAVERNASVFMIEIKRDGPKHVNVELHATLRDDQISQRTVLEALIRALEEAIPMYKKGLADLSPERGAKSDGEPVNEQERAEAVVKGMLLETKPEGATYYRPLSNGNAIAVFPSLFGAGALHLAKQGNTWSESVYDYPDLVDAVNAAAEWSGEGDPPDGWVRHMPSARRRPDGTLASEKIEP